MNRLLAPILTVAGLLVGAPAALATHAQPPLDINKLEYAPQGHFKPGDEIPPDAGTVCDEVLKPLMNGKLFNPSGKFNAHDTNVFETLCLPFRNQDDTSAADPWGNGGGESRHGYCNGADPSDPLDPGVCPNHQLEFIDYYKATMLEILKDFNPAYHEYQFEHPEGIGRNPAIVIPGADHPEQHILIGSHYDQTDTGPASTWDSAEGHAEMIRVAKLMADYWKATGTRPSATVKFVPMDGEEDGLLGSADYVANTIVPGWENNVRGYWNADPCAGGYPARKYGNPAETMPLNVQIGVSEEPDVIAFNEIAPQIVEQTFEHLDDTIDSGAGYPDKPERFISTEEGGPAGSDIGKHVFVSYEHPVAFSSDWANFIAVGIPFFNPTPKVTGPANPEGDPNPLLALQGNDPYGVYGFHTPLDNQQTMSRLTGQTPQGTQFSEAWMDGMEMCAHMLGWGMLQPSQGGAQTINDNPIAYFEATPNEAERGKLVTFDGSASYQYANPAARTFVPTDELQWKWDFADGTKTYFGKVVKHAFKVTGEFNVTLTLTNRTTGKVATMTVPVVVEEGTANEQDPAGQDIDSFIPKKGAIVPCNTASGFRTLSVKPKGKGLRFDFAATGNGSPVKIRVYRASNGRKVAKPKRIASFNAKKPFTWKGSKKAKKGDYYVTFEVIQTDGKADRRTFALTKGKKFKVSKKAYQRADSCGLLSLFRLAAPVFGTKRPLAIAFVTTKDAKVTAQVLRGKKTVKRFSANSKANVAGRFTLKPKGKKFKKGNYTIKLTASAGGENQTDTLYARKR